MTRKHFEKVAAAIKFQKSNIESPSAFLNTDGRAAALNTLGETARRLASIYTAENPSFDTYRFLRACGF